MYPDWSVFATLAMAVIFSWLGIVSFLIWRQNKFLKSLFPKSGERDIRKKFEEIIKDVEGFKGEILGLRQKVADCQKEGLEHTQRVSLLRFNPYNDTGGDQSFIVCLLNSEGSGIVLTSLHARSGTRVFGKEIKSGKGLRYELSKEEKMVIKKAMKQTYE